MKLTTSAQMRELDRIAIEERHIPSVELMERAAEGVAAAVLTLLPDQAAHCRIAALCGAGNNGGDGIAAARLLRDGEKARALRMLECQLERGDGGSYELAFASGLYGYLTGDRERAVAGWKKALMLKPGDERARLNLKNAEAMHGSE